MDPDQVGAAAWELVSKAVDHVMRVLDTVPTVVCVHHQAGMVLLQVADRLAVSYGHCHVHGAPLAGLALLDGRPVQLGHIEDHDDLVAAIVGSPHLGSLDADQLLADLQRARVG